LQSTGPLQLPGGGLERAPTVSGREESIGGLGFHDGVPGEWVSFTHPWWI
jgi:hypothetical protein